MRDWERRCGDHTFAQEHVRDFLALPFGERSRALSSRYLADESVLLAACGYLDGRRFRAPVEVSLEYAALYHLLASGLIDATVPREVVDYFCARLAISTLGAQLGMQHREDAALWFGRIKIHLSRCQGSTQLRALLEHRCVTDLLQRGQYPEALWRADALVSRFEELEMNDYVLITLFLKGLILKDSGQLTAASDVFAAVRVEARERRDAMMESYALAQGAQVLGSLGRFEEGLQTAREAQEAAERSGIVFALALARGTVGELLRDYGDVEAAIDAYAESMTQYEQAGMEGLAAYTRVLIAEMLLMSGRPQAAALEVVSTLDAIEKHSLSQEGVAAVSILREAIKRQQVDPDSIRQVREQLRWLRNEGKI
jgi:tetratricopeptide (TPR) repeat protein